MFYRIFLTQLKVLLQNRTLVFWALVFPLILSMLFNMAFSDLNSAFKFDPVNVAVVNDDAFRSSQSVQMTVKHLSEGDERVFNTSYVDAETASTKLADKSVEGVISIENSKPLVVVRGNGVDETLIKVALDQALQANAALTGVVQKNPSLATSSMLGSMGTTNYLKDASGVVDRTVIYFYSLIGMACMYAALFGIFTVNQREANLSALGARLSITPARKSVTLVGSLLACFVVAYGGELMLYAFLTMILHVPFGSQGSAVLLVMAIGCLAGVSLGMLVGAATKQNENTKTSIAIAITMTGSFLAGMMGTESIKYSVDRHAPWLAAINPVNNISDALLSLHYFGGGEYSYKSLAYLSVFVMTCLVVSGLLLRKKQYASL